MAIPSFITVILQYREESEDLYLVYSPAAKGGKQSVQSRSVFWNGMKVSFVIIGTTIGAGYASGREIWEFFASYGRGSHFSIVLSMLLFALSCYVIMTISHRLQSPHYGQVLEELLGKSLAKCYDVLIFFYLFSTTVVMFAGSGAILSYWNMSYWLGVWITALFVFIIFFRDVEMMTSLNSILTPFMIGVLILTCLVFLGHAFGQDELMASGLTSYPSAIAFTSLNILPLVAILSVFGSKMKAAEIKIASINSAVLLTAISLLYNHSLMLVGDDILLYEVPLFSILRDFPPQLIAGVGLVLWLAIYTTAVSNVFGIVSRFKHVVSFPQWVVAGFFVLLVLPLTQFGFGNLIQFLYPLYGVLNLFLLMTILLYPLADRKKIR